MGGVSNAVGQSSNQPNQQPQYGQQGLGGMAQAAGNAVGGIMRSPFMGQIGQVISGQQPTQSGQQGLGGMAQGVGNAIGGMMQSPFMGQIGQAISGQQPTQSGLTNSPYNSGTPSYGQMPQGIPLIYRPGIDQYQTAPNSQEFSNVLNTLGIGQMSQPMGQPVQYSYTPQPKVMPAYPESQSMLPQNIQQLLGQPQRGFPQQGMPQRGFPQASPQQTMTSESSPRFGGNRFQMMANALRNKRG